MRYENIIMYEKSILSIVILLLLWVDIALIYEILNTHYLFTIPLTLFGGATVIFIYYFIKLLKVGK